MVDATVNPLA